MSAKQYAAAAEMLAFLETERDVPQAEVWAGLASCQVHATLALVEETEVVAEQLRRLADVAEALLLLLQPLADSAAAAGDDEAPGARCSATQEYSLSPNDPESATADAHCSLFAGHGLDHYDHAACVAWE